MSANPYVGLAPFEAKDSLHFFGRREQVLEVLELLHRSRFLPVIGSSGCGKSSLIRAGVLPALQAGFLVAARDRWQVAVMKPGNAPLANLAQALLGASRERVAPEETAQLERNLSEQGLEAILAEVARLDPRTNLLLVVDQFEELFRQPGAQDAADFVELLLLLAERTELPTYIVSTMRSDFLGDCDRFRGLTEAINAASYLVPKLGREQLRQAIVGPPRLEGVEVAPRLVDRALNELAERGDQLPVLQHALQRTWDAWAARGASGPIEVQDFEAIGGCEHALARHAEESLALTDAALARHLLRGLVETDGGGRRVRHPATVEQLSRWSSTPADAVLRVLDVLASGGRTFLVFSGPPGPARRVDITHESLIRQWPRLQAWADEERDDRDEWLRLVDRARREASGRADLLSGRDLEGLEVWLKGERTSGWFSRYSSEADTRLAHGLIERSRAMRSEREAAEVLERRRARDRRRWLAGGAGFLVLAVSIAAAVVTTRMDLRDAEAQRARELLEGNARLFADVAREQAAEASSLTQQRRLLATAYRANHQVGRSDPAIELLTSRAIAELTGLERTLEGARDRSQLVQLSPDGGWLAVVTNDGKLLLRSTHDWQERSRLDLRVDGGTERIVGASLSWNGVAVTVSTTMPSEAKFRHDDFRAALWSEEADGGWRQLTSREGGSAVLSPSGDWIVWQLEDTGCQLQSRHALDAGAIKCEGAPSFSPDGRFVAFAEAGVVVLHELNGGKPRRLEPAPEEFENPYLFSWGRGRRHARFTEPRFSPDSSHLVAVTESGSAIIWATASPAAPQLVPVTERGVELGFVTARFLDDQHLLGKLDDESFVVLDWSTGNIDRRLYADWELPSAGPGFALAEYQGVTGWSAEGKRLWSARLPSGERPISVGLPSGPLLTSLPDGTLRVWNVGGQETDPLLSRARGDDERLETVLRGAPNPNAVVLNAKGDRALVTVFSPSNPDGGLVAAVLGLDRQRFRGPSFALPVDAGVISATLSPDGLQAATVHLDRKARLWQLSTGHLLHVFPPDELGPQSPEAVSFQVAFNATGTLLATPGLRGRTCVWATASGAKVGCVDEGTEVYVNATAFIDDRRLVTATDRTISRWSGLNTSQRVVVQAETRTETTWLPAQPGGPALTTETSAGLTSWGFPADGGVSQLESMVLPRIVRHVVLENGKYWAAIAQEGQLVVSDRQTGRRSTMFTSANPYSIHGGPSPDGGASLVTCGNGVVELWDLEGQLLGKHPLRSAESDTVQCDAVLLPTGDVLAVDRSGSTLIPRAVLEEKATGHALGVSTTLVTGGGMLTRDLSQEVRLWSDSGKGLARQKGSVIANRLLDDREWVLADPRNTVVGLSADGSRRVLLEASPEPIVTLLVDPLSKRGVTSIGRPFTVRDQSGAHVCESQPALLEAPVKDARFTADGKHLVALSDEGTLTELDPLTGRKRRTLSTALGKEAQFERVQGAPDALLLRGDNVSIWRAGKVQVLAETQARGAALLVRPQGESLVLSAQNALSLFNGGVEAWHGPLLGKQFFTRVVAFDEAGESVMLSGRDHLERWGLGSGAPLTRLTAPQADILDAWFEGGFFVYWKEGRLVSLNLKTGEPVDEVYGQGAARAAGEPLYVLGGETPRLFRLTPSGHFETQSVAFEAPKSRVSASISPDGKWIAGVTFDGAQRFLFLWNDTGKLVHSWPAGTSPIWRLRFHPDGSRLLSLSRDRAPRLWAVPTGELIAVLDREVVLGGDYVGGMPLVVTADARGSMFLRNADDCAVLAKLEPAEGSDEAPIERIALEPGLGLLAAVDSAGRVTRWDLRFEPGKGPVQLGKRIAGDGSARLTGLALSRGGAVGIARERGDAELWRGDQVIKLSGHTGSVTDLSFAGEAPEEWVVTASSDKTARLWRASDGKAIWVARSEAPLGSARVSKARDKLIVGGERGLVQVFQLGRQLGSPEEVEKALWLPPTFAPDGG